MNAQPPTDLTGTIAVAIADDHVAVREGLALLVGRLEGYAMVLSATNGEELLQGCREQVVHLALVDLHMPVLDGLATLERMRVEHPAVRCIAYTGKAEVPTVVQVFKAGGRAVLLKGHTPVELLRTLRGVVEEGVYHTAETQRILLEHPDGKSDAERKRDELRTRLPAPWLAVLEMLCRNPQYGYQDMATALHMNRRTVERYAQKLFDQFGVDNKTALVLAALGQGIVRL